MFYFLLGVSLLCELIDDDGCNDVREQHFEESPIDQVGDKAAIVVIFPVSIDILPDDFLSVEGADAGGASRAVLIDPRNIDVDFFTFVQGAKVMVKGDEPKYKW